MPAGHGSDDVAGEGRVTEVVTTLTSTVVKAASPVQPSRCLSTRMSTAGALGRVRTGGKHKVRLDGHFLQPCRLSKFESMICRVEMYDSARPGALPESGNSKVNFSVAEPPRRQVLYVRLWVAWPKARLVASARRSADRWMS